MIFQNASRAFCNLVCPISAVSNEVGALRGGEGLHECADSVPECFCCSFGVVPEQGLQLSKDLLNGVEVGRVWRQVEHVRSHMTNRLHNSSLLVAAEIIHDHDVTWPERRSQELLDVGQEALAGHGTIQNQRGR